MLQQLEHRMFQQLVLFLPPGGLRTARQNKTPPYGRKNTTGRPPDGKANKNCCE
jgi:hypothetical protein